MKREKALDVIRSIYTTDAEKEALQTLIPELKGDEEKESEDERMRKEILAFIRREGQHIDKYKWPKWIAWLEKQKECGEATGKCAKEHPANLEEAAKEYANKEYPDKTSVGEFGIGPYTIDRGYLREIAKDAFKAGAEWAEEQKPEVKLTGWVSRDRNGEVYVYGAYPEKDSEKGIWIESNSILLYRRSFLDLKWEDDPVEVEITIKRG